MATLEKTEIQETFLSIEELADRYKVPVQTVRVWRMKGKDPKSFKLGRHVRYRLSDVEQWEAEKVQ